MFILSSFKNCPETLKFGWLSQQKSLSGNDLVFRLFLQMTSRVLNTHMYYLGLLPLCPSDVIILSLGQYIRYKNSKGTKVFFWRILHQWLFPLVGAAVVFRVLGGDGARLPLFFDFYRCQLFLVAPLAPETETTGRCSTIWVHGLTIDA